MANRYDLEFLKGLINQQETQRLEFKSSRDLLSEESQKRAKFLKDQVVPTVSAFLNTDGGLLILGVEDNKDGVAVNLSDGVPRSRMKREQLQSSICDRIQPAVAGYISVFDVPLGEDASGNKLFAFVVEVRPGVTAYQADDKLYYVRRSGQSEAMEDKDIRLRMLAADKPRVDIRLQPRIIPGQDVFSRYIQIIVWDLWFENLGVTNIPNALARSILNLQGLDKDACGIISSGTPEYVKTTFSMETIEHSGLLPGQRFKYSHIKIPPVAFHRALDVASIALSVDITVFIDNGLPSQLRNYDLMADVRSIVGDVSGEWLIQPDMDTKFC